jgi:hypothetical protein
MKQKLLGILLFFVVHLFIADEVFSQNANRTIKGKVYNNTKQPLVAATIVLADANNKVVFNTSTDQTGSFTFNHDKEGNYTLSISFTGFKTFTSTPFKLTDKDFGDITLGLLSNDLKEVAVQAKQNLIELDANSITYNVSKSITAQGSNALDVLKRAPSVFVDNDNTISINGKPGAMILIDGKQSYLSNREIADLLKAMPSSNIKSIEIINTPSAKYDAAGTAGMINIKTMKSQLVGFNGSITTGLSYGETIKQNEDLSFNYRKDKTNVYGSYNHFFGNYTYLYGGDRLQNGNSYNSDTYDVDKRKRLGTRLGVDYSLDAKNTFGLLLTGNFIFGGGITDTETEINIPSTNTQQNLRAINDYYHQNTERYNININYKFEDSLGRILNIDADYGYYEKNAGNLQSNRYTDKLQQLLNENLYRTLNGANINLKAAKVDYTTNLWKGKLETGSKYSFINTGNDSKFSQVFANNEVLDERRSNQFSFEEAIASVYVNYKKTIGKLILQGGLRVENAKSTGALTYKTNGVVKDEVIKRDYTNLFPSVSFSFKPATHHSFSIGYSRRIDRPAYQDLNPFVYLLDELSFWAGNPFLKPQLSHRLNLQYAFKNATIIGLNYSYTNDFKANITDTTDVDKIVMIPRNVGTQQNIALSLTQTITAAKWWEITFNSTIYNLKNEVSFDAYRNFNLNQWAGRLNLQQTFKLPLKFTGEVIGIYNTKRLIGANEIIDATSQVDLGLQRNLFNNKAIIRLVFTDIYKGSEASSSLNFEGLQLRNYSYYETRQIKLNFTYKITNSKLGAPRTRNSALESENGRIK